ncbi:protein TIME FOR COFFEE isoform X1 [Castanea sativa]|uniref:protein TIME FOR COFFEE isoform X1 n=1 Tax=Castanea sativa TaxID=21020 RepID=UPI003F64B893
MERSREARRPSSSSMATGNGQPKRRHRSNSLRDSPEEGQVELQEAVKFRSKRDRESLMNNRSKRKRTSSKREEGEESTEESVGDEEDEEYSTVVDDHNHRRPARSSRHWKVADEMIGVSVPRKARSSSAKRAHENLVSANGGKEELKAQPPNSEEDIEIEIAEVLYGLMKQSQSQSNKSSGNSSHELDPNANPNDINGLSTVAATATATQTCTKKRKLEGEKSSGTVENSEIESEQLEKTETSSSPKECVSLESQQEVDAAITVIMEEEEEEDLKSSDKEAGIGDCVSPRKESATPCGGDELNAVEDVQDSTKEVLTVPEAENKREEKLEIDLMAMPPMPSSPDVVSFIDLIADHKPPVKDEEKVEKFVKKEMVIEESEDRRKNKVEAIGEKSELPKLDLEKLTQDSGSVRSSRLQQQQQAKASIPKVEKTAQSDSLPFPIAVPGWLGGLPSLGYMPPFQTVVPMDGITTSATPLQPPQFSLSQPRPNRCATHHFIARNICLHQQYTKMSNFCPMPAGTAALGGAKMNNLNAMPPAEKMIFGNPFQGSFPGKSLNAVPEKGQAETNFPGHTGKDKGREAANLTETAQRKQVVLQQAPQLAPAGSLMSGPAFIFSMGQHPAVAAAGANQSGSSKHANSAKNIPLTSNTAAGSLGNNCASGPLGSSSVLPAVATAMSFNYPTFPANEAPYMAILQNNGYPVPISTPVGTSTAFRGSNPAQTMPFFNGPFYSSHMFHPSQLQQQQPHLQPLAQTTHQSTSTSSGLSSSHKQPRGAQGSGNNLLAPSKQHVPPSNQSRKNEAEMTRENTQSVADSRASHTQKSVYAQNFTVPGQPLNYTLMPSAALGVSSGGNHGEKQQQGLKNVVELFPSPAFGMSFAAFNGNTTASTLNFSSMPQNPVIFQSLPDMGRQGYQVSQASQAAQPKNHQVSEGKSGANSINSDDAKKATLGKPSTTTGQTLVFDNSARTLSFMSSPVVTGNWPSRSITSTTITTNAPTAGNTSNSQQQQLLQLQMQKQHVMQQQQPALSARSKASTTNSLSSSPIVAKFPTNPPVFSQTLIHSNSSVQSSQSKNAGRNPSSQAPTASSVASNAPFLNYLSQQPGRAPSGPAQISFGGNSKPALSPQGQQMHTNNRSSSTSASGSPSTGGNLRTNSTGGKVGSSTNTLQSQQTENSSGGTGQKSSPVCGRNVPSILSTCPSHMSELKY